MSILGNALTPKDLFGLINRCTHKRSIQIGRIDLLKSFSSFEVEERQTFTIMSSFKGVEYNGREVTVEVAQEDSVPEQRPPKENPATRSPYDERSDRDDRKSSKRDFPRQRHERNKRR